MDTVVAVVINKTKRPCLIELKSAILQIDTLGHKFKTLKQPFVSKSMMNKCAKCHGDTRVSHIMPALISALNAPLKTSI